MQFGKLVSQEFYGKRGTVLGWGTGSEVGGGHIEPGTGFNSKTVQNSNKFLYKQVSWALL